MDIPKSYTKSQLLAELFRLGHFRNPEMPTGIVSEGQLDDLSLDSDEVHTAIRSYQTFLRDDFDRLSVEIHGRPGVADGDIGPATEALLQLPRCGQPDIPEDAYASGQSRSWPKGCWQEYPDHHAFAVYFDKSRMPSFWEPVFDAAWGLVKSAARDMGMIYFESTSRENCNTVVTWQAGRGWIGLAIVPSYPKCKERIWAKFDTRYRPSNLTNQIAMLLAHEFGHNMGLSHFRGGVMNPSIWSGRFTETMWRGDPAEGHWKRWFGGVPIPKDDDGGDDGGGEKPPTNDHSISVHGTVMIGPKDGEKKPFVLVPKVTV